MLVVAVIALKSLESGDPRLRAALLYQHPGAAVLDRLRDAANATCDHRHPGRHGLGDDVRESVPVAVPGHLPREQQHIRPGVLLEYGIVRQRPHEGHKPRESELRGPPLERSFKGASPDDPRLESQTRRLERGVNCELIEISLLLNEPADRHNAHRVATDAPHTPRGQSIQAPANEHELCRIRTSFQQTSARGLARGNNERSVLKLARQSPIAAVPEDIIGVRPQREGNACQLPQELRCGPRHGRPNGVDEIRAIGWASEIACMANRVGEPEQSLQGVEGIGHARAGKMSCQPEENARLPKKPSREMPEKHQKSPLVEAPDPLPLELAAPAPNGINVRLDGERAQRSELTLRRGFGERREGREEVSDPDPAPAPALGFVAATSRLQFSYKLQPFAPHSPAGAAFDSHQVLVEREVFAGDHVHGVVAGHRLGAVPRDRFAQELLFSVALAA